MLQVEVEMLSHRFRQQRRVVRRDKMKERNVKEIRLADGIKYVNRNNGTWATDGTVKHISRSGMRTTT